MTDTDGAGPRDPGAKIHAGDGPGVEGDLAASMGVEYLEASAERVVGRMPVKGNTQPYGLLHGGASCVLAESLGSVGSALHAGPGRIAVGIEINATHHRSATEGTSRAWRPACTAAAPSPPTTSSSPTSRTGGCAPHASPACCGTPPPGLIRAFFAVHAPGSVAWMGTARDHRVDNVRARGRFVRPQR